MAKRRTVEEIRAWRSNPRLRRKILESGWQPLIMSDGKDRYWDGWTAIRKDAATWRGNNAFMAWGNKELRIMAKEGLFPEARGAIIDSFLFWELLDMMSGYRCRRFALAVVVATGESRTSEGNRKEYLKEG